MAQEVERRIGNAEVTGPTPVASLLTALESYKDFRGFYCIQTFARKTRKNNCCMQPCARKASK